MGAIVEAAAVAWPFGLTLAALALGDLRLASRRRALNRSLHELRRPLQALVLCADARARAQVERAIDALADLDRELNGGSPPLEVLAEPASLARAAAERWRGPVRAAGREIRLRWSAGDAPIICEPAAISRALDNLIANALEHGRGQIEVAGVAGAETVRILVTDFGGEGSRRPPGRPPARGPRRGHGLAIVSAVAARHRGRFACSIEDGRTTAALELPLAPRG